MSKILELIDLCVEVDSKLILNKLNLKLEAGSVSVLMGPNGAGKSTISNVIMGNPQYKLISGKIIFEGEDISNLKTEKRAKKGLFMSFQHPIELSGVTLSNFLRTSYNLYRDENVKVTEFHKLLKKKMSELKMDPKFRTRFLNFGFSGGEKKKSEILQLMLFEPKFAILDEIDSGLDVDALKLISSSINKLKSKNNMGILIITHYNKILDYIKPDNVYILKSGSIVKSGGADLAKKIDKLGFN